MTLKKMFKKICIALYFISKKFIKSCYEKVFLQPQKFVLCKFVLCKTVLAEGCLYFWTSSLFFLDKIVSSMKLFLTFCLDQEWSIKSQNMKWFCLIKIPEVRKVVNPSKKIDALLFSRRKLLQKFQQKSGR